MTWTEYGIVMTITTVGLFLLDLSRDGHEGASFQEWIARFLAVVILWMIFGAINGLYRWVNRASAA